jgi:MFS family permease
MYKYDWIEQLKLRSAPFALKTGIGGISPVIWSLGLTSFLTDISAEMVNSILPVYLVLHLHLTPLRYGAIDGVYNGLSVALVSVAAGITADRWSRQKLVAGVGYGLSALCKLLLLAGASLWGWIAVILALDRMGKGIRTAPRDALISLNAPAERLATAYGVHRAMDSAGALVGPVVAFALLAWLPNDFASLWLVSFIVAVLGVAALWLFVPGRTRVAQFAAPGRSAAARTVAISPQLVGLTVCGTVLALATISDGFLYLLLQEKTGTSANIVPLFFVVTACAYMIFSLPVAVCADRWGRRRVFVGGYAALGVLYAVLLASPASGLALQIGCLLLLGLYYAGTEGVLMALASLVVPAEKRTTGLAVVATSVGVGKLLSSVFFGWMWQTYGTQTSIAVFAATLLAAMIGVGIWLWCRHRG